MRVLLSLIFALALSSCADEDDRFTATEQDFLAWVHSDDYADEDLLKVAYAVCEVYAAAPTENAALNLLFQDEPLIDKQLYFDIIDRATDTLCPL